MVTSATSFTKNFVKSWFAKSFPFVEISVGTLYMPKCSLPYKTADQKF